MDDGFLFNKLWVIESLPECDLKTGKNLVEGKLEEVKRTNPELLLAFEQPETMQELIQLLEKIHDEVQTEGLYPIIHFECHGCQDGLCMANNEFVTWDELRKILIDINQACKLNLMIVLAACNGAHLIKVATKMDRAPFWAIIGPEVEVTAGDIEKDFGEFYKIFFDKLDGDAAVDAINQGVARPDRKYHFLSVTGIFIRAYTRYYNNHCIGKGKRKRREDLLTQAMQNPEVQKRGINWARRKVKEGLAGDAEHFNKMKDRFFFIDKYPENAGRFTLSYDELLERVKH
jgi:hypothetical protein